jgi:type IV pilus assembly protein PilQ
MRLARGLACLIAVACTRETSERPPPGAAAHASLRPALPLPETAFEETHFEESTPRRMSVPSSQHPAETFSGARIDLDVKGADVHDVLRLLADVGRVSIVVADDVKGIVTLKLRRVPWDQALDVVAQTLGLAIERERNVVVVRAH